MTDEPVDHDLHLSLHSQIIRDFYLPLVRGQLNDPSIFTELEGDWTYYYASAPRPWYKRLAYITKWWYFDNVRWRFQRYPPAPASEYDYED